MVGSGVPAFDAVVLAGGSARRMGGVDKAALVVGRAALLDRVLAAAVDAGAARVVVVGPRRAVASPLGDAVVWTREEPPGGGPVAALAAALPSVRSPFVALLAADLPFVTGETVASLLAAASSGAEGAGAEGADGALLVDPTGRDQPLTSVWRADALRAALPEVVSGVALRSVLGSLRALRRPADARTCTDCDDPADLARARTLL